MVGPMAARSCRSCGVSVALGYARCPRCRTPLELEGVDGAELSRARRISGAPGGTSMAPAPSSSRWLVAGAAASIAVGALAAFLLVRRPPAAAPPPASEQGALEAPGEPEPSAIVAPAEATPVAAPPASSEALGGLRSMLGKARLFAQLASAGDRLELRSASCDDSQLPVLLAEAREALWQAGIRHVRCLEPHGQVVFERDL